MLLVRAFLRYGAQILLVLSPLFTAQWSILNWLGHPTAGPTDVVEVSILGVHILGGAKQEVELTLRMMLTALALVMVMAYDVVDSYLPSRSMQQFRKEYLDAQAAGE